MPDDKPTTERSITASIAVFLFAIAKNWREVRVSDGTRIPNHLFASSREPDFSSKTAHLSIFGRNGTFRRALCI